MDRPRRSRTNITVSVVAVLGVACCVALFATRTNLDLEPTSSGTGDNSQGVSFPPHITSADMSQKISDLVDNPTPSGCHTEAHALGRQASTLGNPATALALNTDELDQRCQYGYIHGVFQGYADQGRKAIEIAAASCSTTPGGSLVVSECYHAAGHGAAITTTSLTEALDECSKAPLPHDVDCATGAFMEYAERYRYGPAIPPEASGYAPLLDEEAALNICTWTHSYWRTVCAKEAATFWYPTDPRPATLGRRCATLVEASRSDLDAYLCGIGVGRNYQNASPWVDDNIPYIPETIAHAQIVSRTLASLCTDAARAAHWSLEFSRGCLEGATQPIMSGQVISQVPIELWLNVCAELDILAVPARVIQECDVDRSATIDDALAIQ